jgi:hypothetical protein
MSPLHSSSQSSISPLSLPLFSRFSDQIAVSPTPTVVGKPYQAMDIAIAVGIVGLLVALLIPTLNSRAITLPTVTRSLVDHLRLARAGAASRGTHFRVTLQANAYVIEQLQDGDGDGTWDPDAQVPAWRVSLPPTVAIGDVADTTIEFDARGLVTTASQDQTVQPVTVKLTDLQTEKSAMIKVLPSGRVQSL